MIYKKIEIKVEGYQETADLYTYILDNSVEMHPDRKRPVVVICPGGGYEMTSDREAEPIAMQYLARGYHAVILRYSVAPARYPLALMQLAKTVAYLREHAGEFHIDTDKIILQGFSAGGHLAASLGVFWREKFISEALHTDAEMVKPNGMILSYPVITSGKFAHMGSFEALLGENSNDSEKRKKQSLEFQVTEDTPPTFLWHTVTDDTVPVENSMLFFRSIAQTQSTRRTASISVRRSRPQSRKRRNQPRRWRLHPARMPVMDRTCVHVDWEFIKEKKVFHSTTWNAFFFCEIFCNVSDTYIVIYVKEEIHCNAEYSGRYTNSISPSYTAICFHFRIIPTSAA